jgi:hypothetical protein
MVSNRPTRGGTWTRVAIPGRVFTSRALLLVLLPVIGPLPSARSGDQAELDAIKQQFARRQQHFRTVKFSWNGAFFASKGFYAPAPSVAPWLLGGLPNAWGPLPPEDHTFDMPCSMSLDENKLRFEYKMHAWITPKRRYEWQTTISAFDGQGCKSFEPDCWLGFPCGTIRKHGPASEDAKRNLLEPILMTFRPNDPHMGPIRCDKLALGDHRRLEDGSMCVLVEQADDVGTYETFWLDPAREYAVLRFTRSEADGKPYYQLDVQYSPHGADGWIPTAWHMIFLKDKGPVKEEYSAKVNQRAINEPIAASEFQIEFPPGTSVSDENANGEGERYIVREDGSKRVIQRQELSASYDRIIATAPGTATADTEGDRKLWRLLGACGIMALCFLLLSGAIRLWCRLRVRSM